MSSEPLFPEEEEEPVPEEPIVVDCPTAHPQAPHQRQRTAPVGLQAALAKCRDEMIAEASQVARMGKAYGPHEFLKFANRWFRKGYDAKP